MFKKSIAVAIMAAFTLSAHANSDTSTWQVSLGFGAASLPTYLDDNRNRVAFAPDICVTVGERFFASYALNKDCSLVGYGSVSRLSDEIADSSLIKTRGSDTQSSIGTFLSILY